VFCQHRWGLLQKCRRKAEHRNVRPRLQFNTQLAFRGLFLIILGEAFSNLRHCAPNYVVGSGVIGGLPAKDINTDCSLFQLSGAPVQSPLGDVPQNRSITFAVLEYTVFQNPLKLLPDELPLIFRIGASNAAGGAGPWMALQKLLESRYSPGIPFLSPVFSRPLCEEFTTVPPLSRRGHMTGIYGQ
jgi:hypothetical protein